MIRIKNNKIQFILKEHCENLKPLIEKKLKGKESAVYKFLKQNLETILIGTPNELENKIINEIPNINRCKKDIKKIFSYKSFTSIYSDRYGAYKLSKLLDINVCPYCNRQYTFTLKEKKGKTRPEFDHFFSQERYPYLALSLYNLIPSCHICNSNLKGTAEFNLEQNIHPYIEDFEDILKFRIKLRNKREFKVSEIKHFFGVNFFNGSSESFDIKIKIDNPQSLTEIKANNNIDTFHIETLYNQHKDYIIELIQKAEIYSPEYIESIFREYEGKLFNNISDVYRMLLSNYVLNDDFDKRVLSKLTRDISEELGILV